MLRVSNLSSHAQAFHRSEVYRQFPYEEWTYDPNYDQPCEIHPSARVSSFHALCRPWYTLG